MSDEASYHIYAHHPEWDSIISLVATSKEQASKLIGTILREHHDGMADMTIHMVYGVPVEVAIKHRDVAVVKLGDDKFFVGTEDEDTVSQS